jgi:hypothetical protein
MIVGISKGIKYKLLKVDIDNKTGLVDNVWGFAVWCKFDKIIIKNPPKKVG